MMERLLPYLLVGLGSFVGGNARYAIAQWVGGVVDARFPLATFLINVSGSFVLEEKVRSFLPVVDELVTEGLVTLEAVRILKYVAPGK